MAKSLKDILAGVKKSKVVPGSTGDDPGVDYAEKSKDGREFVAQHKIEKHEDRVGNDDKTYNASNIKRANLERKGHVPDPKSKVAYTSANEALIHFYEKVNNKKDAGVDSSEPATNSSSDSETHQIQFADKPGKTFTADGPDPTKSKETHQIQFADKPGKTFTADGPDPTKSSPSTKSTPSSDASTTPSPKPKSSDIPMTSDNRRIDSDGKPYRSSVYPTAPGDKRNDDPDAPQNRRYTTRAGDLENRSGRKTISQNEFEKQYGVGDDKSIISGSNNNSALKRRLEGARKANPNPSLARLNEPDASNQKRANVLAAAKKGPYSKEKMMVKEEQLDEKAPPGAKFERMVKHIKDTYSKYGHLSAEKEAIAYATAWKAKNKEQKESVSDDQPMYDGKGKKGRQLLVDRKRVKEQAPADTAVQMPSTKVSDTGRV